MAIGTAAALAAGGGALLGAGKGIANKKANARDKMIRAITVENSPWTGMGDPGQKERAGLFDTTLQGSLGGLMAGQQFSGGAGVPTESASQLNTAALAPAINQATPLTILDALKAQGQLTNPMLQEQPGRNIWGGFNTGSVG